MPELDDDAYVLQHHTPEVHPVPSLREYQILESMK